MSQHPAGQAALLEVRDLSKTFPGQRALDGVRVNISRGEIHGLVGHNGSGKSTLVKILSGFHEPDPEGRILIDGLPARLGSADAAHRAGLRFVHQDLALVNDLPVADNFALGTGFVTGKGGRIRWSRQRRHVESAIGQLGHRISATSPVGSLSPAERTIVAVARALDPRGTPPRMLVLDEVTAALPAAEAERIFQPIRSVRDRGLAVLYISHHLDEVLEICDRITVLRLGQVVGTYDRPVLTRGRLVELMVGESPANLSAAAAGWGRVPGERRAGLGLEARDLAGAELRHLDLDVGPGVVVGVTGISGSGREELASLLFGVSYRAGVVTVDGQIVPPGNPKASIRAGMVLVPADRARTAMFETLDARQNVTISDLSDFWSRGMLSGKREAHHVRHWLRRLMLDPAVAGRAMGLLSGGMQQKVVLARALRLSPKVLILDQPTQGVDVQTKEVIYEQVRVAARSGTAVLVISSDSEDLCRVADQILVLRGGCVGAAISSRDEPTPSQLDALQLAGQF